MQITSPLVRASPRFSLVPLLPTPSSCLVRAPLVSAPLCVSLPASLGSPEALPLWPETSNVPKLGSRLPWVSTHTLLFPLSRACFRPVLLFPSATAKAPEGQEEDGAGSPRDPGAEPLPRDLLRELSGLGPAPLSSPWPLLRTGDLKVLLRLLLSCGHRRPHTLREEAFPPFASPRPPPVPRSPILPSKPLPQMQMSVCACLWGHMRRARVWLCV